MTVVGDLLRAVKRPTQPTASINMNLWKRKLVAYLHDPPHKPVGIRDHEQQRESFLNRFGLSTEDMAEFEKSADWQAAAADRLVAS